jgi:hypothetical protein
MKREKDYKNVWLHASFRANRDERSRGGLQLPGGPVFSSLPILFDSLAPEQRLQLLADLLSRSSLDRQREVLECLINELPSDVLRGLDEQWSALLEK